MKKNGLSCREFSALSNIAAVTLYRLEKETNDISLRTFRKLEKTMKNYKKEDII